METIIRTPLVALQTRQLKRPGSKGGASTAAVPSPVNQTPVAALSAASPVPPPIPVQNTLPEKKEPPAPSAAEIRLQVERELERELANARAQIDQELAGARERAERDGYKAGLEKGEAAAKKAAAEQVEQLASIAAALHQSRQSIVESAEDLIVEIAYTAICRIIGQAATEPAAVAGMVNQVLSASRERDQLVLRLNPQDLELVQQSSHVAALGPRLALRADPAINIGGCVIESETGNLDARLETQLARLCESLLAVRNSRENAEGSV